MCNVRRYELVESAARAPVLYHIAKALRAKLTAVQQVVSYQGPRRDHLDKTLARRLSSELSKISA